MLLLIQRGQTDLATLLKRHEPEDLVAARHLVARSGTIDETLALSDHYAEEAARALQYLVGPTAPGLRTLPRAYFAWALEHFLPEHDTFGDAG